MNTYSEAATPAEEVAEVQDSIETTFALERDLQNALRTNISQLQDGLKIEVESEASWLLEILLSEQSPRVRRFQISN